jgi:hypothetical protein
MAKRRKPKSSSAAVSNRFSSEVIRWREGDTSKADPVFILILNNIAFEEPLGSNNFIPDMWSGSTANRALFETSAEYVNKNLFGEVSGQAEKLLADSPHAQKIKLWSMYVWGLPINSASSLVGEHPVRGSDALLPRRDAVVAMLAYLGLNPDIVFLVTDSSYTRAWSIATTDDDSRGGVAATYDGATIYHRFYHKIPGMSAINTRSSTMTAAHELGHAFSSFTNGHIADLYVDGGGCVGFNRKYGRPIPNDFAGYQAATYVSDPTRAANGGYESGWTSYHPEPTDPSEPALMDDYHYTTLPMLCLHDKITKAYILDRIAAKVSR